MRPPARRPCLLLVARALPCVLAVVTTAGAAQASEPLRDRWAPDDLRTLASLRLVGAAAARHDASNAFEADADAAALGRALFEDKRLSRDARVACTTCHAPDDQFEDHKPVGEGLAQGVRRTMPIAGAFQSPFLFWDGRKDSLWSQALGPLEDPAEHGTNRVRLAQVIRTAYASPYEQVFGPLPALPESDATPLGSEGERAAWAALPIQARERVNRVFANIGKAIAAYESHLRYGPSRFDDYVRATAAGDAAGQAVLSLPEVRGLRLFIGAGRCVTCHRGPMLTDVSFHNTGVPPRDPRRHDRGRVDAVPKLLADEFNCLGRYSDARPEECNELQYLVADDPGQVAAFRTPSLRNVAARPPYMHAGQFATLQEVVEHYARSPQAALGRSELPRPDDARSPRAAIRLSPDDVKNLAAFLEALTGPVVRTP